MFFFSFGHFFLLHISFHTKTVPNRDVRTGVHTVVFLSSYTPTFYSDTSWLVHPFLCVLFPQVYHISSSLVSCGIEARASLFIFPILLFHPLPHLSSILLSGSLNPDLPSFSLFLPLSLWGQAVKVNWALALLLFTCGSWRLSKRKEGKPEQQE